MRRHRRAPAAPSAGARLIALEAAWERLLPCIQALPACRVSIVTAAGRVLAEAVRARVDVPFADVSAMDGYALAGDVGAGDILPVLGRIAAGASSTTPLPPGASVRIMTGAPLPPGADRVVPVEDTDGDSERVAIRVAPAAGAHVRRRGEIHRAGDALLARGERLGPSALALLAANGIVETPVHAPPRLALLVTGDEVVAPEETPGPGQLRDSHTAFLTAAAAAGGATVTHLGIARDDPGEIRDRLAHGLDADLLLVTGGVSRGELDFVEPVLAGLGFEPLFDAVAIQPGKPVAASVLRRSGAAPLVAIGLPGNPASAMVCFWLLVRPALRRLTSLEAAPWADAVTATSESPLPAAGSRDRFLPGRLETRDGALSVEPIAARGSHDLAAFAHANALVRVRAGSAAAAAGEVCSVLPLDPLGY